MNEKQKLETIERIEIEATCISIETRLDYLSCRIIALDNIQSSNDDNLSFIFNDKNEYLEVQVESAIAEYDNIKQFLIDYDATTWRNYCNNRCFDLNHSASDTLA